MSTISKTYSRYRWIVLFSYMLTGILSQIIWITFAPILPIVKNLFNISEAEVGLLSAVYPLTFIFLALPSGYYIDSRGFRKGVLIGTMFLSIFGLFRAFAKEFPTLLVLQTISGFGQPFIFNSISKLVKGWFPPEEEGLATGLGSLSIYLGIIIGLSLTPILTLTFGYYNMLYIYGILSVLILLLFYTFGKESPYKIREKEYLPIREFLGVFKNRNVILLSILAFIGVGIFTAYTTWVEVILEYHGIGVELAGVIGSIMIIGGIFGSITIPGLSDKIGKRKILILVSLLLATILFYLHTLIYSTISMGITLFVLGFFFMATLPLALELSANSVENKYVGSANAILWLFSQIGSLILIVAFEGISAATNWDYSLYFSSILLIIALLLAVGIREK